MWSYLIIASIVFLAIPKVVFHDHGHDHTHNEADQGENHFDEDCFVCDFDLTSLAGAIQIPVQIQSQAYSSLVIAVESPFRQRNLSFTSSRGPPVLV